MFSNRIARWLLFMPALFVLRHASAADAVPPAAASTQISIRWVPVSGESNGVAAEVLGLDRQTLAMLQRLPPKDSEWQRLFPVQVEQGEPLAGIGLPPVAGAYLIESGV